MEFLVKARDDGAVRDCETFNKRRTQALNNNIPQVESRSVADEDSQPLKEGLTSMHTLSQQQSARPRNDR